MPNPTIAIDYDALQAGIFLLNSISESFRFESTPGIPSGKSKGAMIDSMKACFTELDTAESQLLAFVENTRKVLIDAGIKLEQSEADIIAAVNKLGLIEY
jgi:hypothetical protein